LGCKPRRASVAGASALDCPRPRGSPHRPRPASRLSRPTRRTDDSRICSPPSTPSTPSTPITPSTHGVAGGRCNPPAPTPPCVRFRTRRFCRATQIDGAMCAKKAAQDRSRTAPHNRKGPTQSRIDRGSMRDRVLDLMEAARLASPSRAMDRTPCVSV